MALGEFTKQLAQQAILSATKEPAAKDAAPAQPEGTGAVILGQIAAMQKALKQDEELALYFQSGPSRIRVMEVFLPSPRVAVLSGIDQDRSFARVIAPVDTLQLLVRIAKTQPGAKAAKVALVQPKA